MGVVNQEGNHQQRKAASDRQQPALAARLRVTLLRLSRNLRSERVADLSEGQHSVVAHLVLNGSMTVGQLAECEHVRPPSMTRTVDALQQGGYVTRVPLETDRRQVLVSPTDKAREHIRLTRQRRDQWISKRLAALTASERATLAEAEAILRRMYQQ